MDDPIDVQVYYAGLDTRHWVAVQGSTTFGGLKKILACQEFAGIPIKNQRLIYFGRIPRDTDTMAMHDVPSGHFRVCMIPVKSSDELLALEMKAAVEEEPEEDQRQRQYEATISELSSQNSSVLEVAESGSTISDQELLLRRIDELEARLYDDIVATTTEWVRRYALEVPDLPDDLDDLTRPHDLDEP